VTGDWVAVDAAGAIVAVLERSCLLERLASGDGVEAQAPRAVPTDGSRLDAIAHPAAWSYALCSAATSAPRVARSIASTPDPSR
jgi:hypothetical protein